MGRGNEGKITIFAPNPVALIRKTKITFSFSFKSDMMASRFSSECPILLIRASFVCVTNSAWSSSFLREISPIFAIFAVHSTAFLASKLCVGKKNTNWLEIPVHCFFYLPIDALQRPSTSQQSPVLKAASAWHSVGLLLELELDWCSARQGSPRNAIHPCISLGSEFRSLFLEWNRV